MEKHKLQEIPTFPPPPQPKSQQPPPTPPITSVELAGIAISLKARLKSTNMPPLMQEHAMRSTRSLVDSAPKSKNRPNPSYIARSLKQEFDTKYGPAWHCIVGTSFGSFVTHSPGGFIYFSMDDSLSFLLFKTEVKLVQS